MPWIKIVDFTESDRNGNGELPQEPAEPQESPAATIEDFPPQEPISDNLLELERQAVALVAGVPYLLPALEGITLRDRRCHKMLEIVRDLVSKGSEDASIDLDKMGLFSFEEQFRATENLTAHGLPTEAIKLIVSSIRSIQQKEDLDDMELAIKSLKDRPQDTGILDRLSDRIERFLSPATGSKNILAKWGQSDRPQNGTEARSRRPAVILDGLLYSKSKLILGGVAKVGKSYFAMKMAYALAQGIGFLKWNAVKPQKVLYIDFELHQWELDERCAAVCDYRVPDEMGTVSLREHHTVRDTASLGKVVRQHGIGADVIILDCLYKFNDAEDENDNAAMKSIGAWMDGVIRDTGAAVILVHHFGKGAGQGRDSIDRFRGASSIVGEMDGILGISKHEEEEYFIVETTARSFTPTDPFVAHWNYPHWVLAEGKDASKAAKPGIAQSMSDEAILDAIPSGKINAKSFEELDLPITRKTFDRRIRDISEIQDTRIQQPIGPPKKGFFKGGLYE